MKNTEIGNKTANISMSKLKTRKLCYRKDVRAMHNPTICTWFAARKFISTI